MTMKDHERTQLSYVAHALARAKSSEQWESILDVAGGRAEPNTALATALAAIRRALEQHQTLRPVVQELVNSKDPSAVTAGRALAWSIEDLNSERPGALGSALPR